MHVQLGKESGKHRTSRAGLRLGHLWRDKWTALSGQIDRPKWTTFRALPFCDRLVGFQGEREIFIDNLLVRVHLIIDMSGPALRHGRLNPLFQVALYLPS